MIEEQLTNAGIIDLFHSYYSVDSVETYKPFKEIYQYAAKEENLYPIDIVMVATHDLDLFGVKKLDWQPLILSAKSKYLVPLHSGGY